MIQSPRRRPVPAPTAPGKTSGHATALKRVVLVVGFVVVALVMRQVTPHSFTHTLPGAGDPDFNVWVMGWVAHNLAHPAHLFDANDFWPHPLALAYSDDLITLAPIFAAVRAVTGNEQAAAGTVDLTLVMVALAATYALVKWLLDDRRVAALAALAFTFNAYTQTHIVQVQLESVGLLSLAFLTMFWTLEHQRLRDGAALGVATALVTLTSPYYGGAWAIAAVVCLIGWLLWKRRVTSRLLAALAVAAAITAVALGPVVYEYRRAGMAGGLTRPLIPQYAFHVRDLLTPALGNWLYGTHLAGVSNPPGENSLFPGFVVLFLAVVGAITLIPRRLRPLRHSIGPSRHSIGGPARSIVAPGRSIEGPGTNRRGYVVLLVTSGVVAAIMAAGGHVGGLPGPFLFLYHHVPGYDRVEVTARLAVVTLLALAVLAACGAKGLLAALPGRVMGSVLVVGCCGLVLLEAVGTVNRHTVDDDPAALAVYRTLSHQPPGAVVELPMIDPAAGPVWNFVEDDRLRNSTLFDYKPRVGGVAPSLPADYELDVHTLNQFPAPAAQARIAVLHVRYVVLHVGTEVGYPMYTPAQASAILAHLPAGAHFTREGDAWLIVL